MKIVSIKPFTPPSSGDPYLHPTLGKILLRSRGPGDSWWASTHANPSYRLLVKPSSLKRYHEDEAESTFSSNSDPAFWVNLG